MELLINTNQLGLAQKIARMPNLFNQLAASLHYDGGMTVLQVSQALEGVSRQWTKAAYGDGPIPGDDSE